LRVANANTKPDSAIAQNWPALELYAAGEFDRAAPYIAKARLLIERTHDPEDGFHATWLSLAEAHRLWLNNEPEKALAIVNAAKPHSTQPTVMAVFRLQVMAAYLTLGRLAQAERIAMSATAPAEQSDLLMEALAMRGDRSRLAQLSEHYTTAEDTSRIAWLPLPFDVFEPQLRRLHKSRPTTGLAFAATSLLVDGRLALADGQVDKAIALLQSALVRRPERGIGRLMSISMLLADAFVAKHDIALAIDALETATQQRSMTSYGASQGATWLAARAKLAELYRDAGRTADAENIEQHLQRLLMVADDDHPLKVKLSRRGEVTDSPRSAQSLRRQP
jgi:tetratricopeptide (TPR) repeat protein